MKAHGSLTPRAAIHPLGALLAGVRWQRRGTQGCPYAFAVPARSLLDSRLRGNDG